MRLSTRTLAALTAAAALLTLASPVAHAAPLPPAPTFGQAIEDYPYRDPAPTGCASGAQAGTLDWKDFLLRHYPNTRNLGIFVCNTAGGAGGHDEGRAFDWGVNANNPVERDQAETVLGWLLAPDRFGNQHALARRIGIRFIIWNRRILHLNQQDKSWRPYSGASPHTDHVHFEMTWAGARRQTSWWTGRPSASDGNLATAADLVPSSSYEAGGWTRHAVNDGVLGSTRTSGWSSDGQTGVNHAEALEFRLPGRRWFDAVTLYPRDDPGNIGQGFPADFAIEVWNGSAWVPVASRTGYPLPSAGAHRFPFPAQWTDRVRVHGTSLRANPNDGNRFRMQFAEAEIHTAAAGRVSATSSIEDWGWSAQAVNDGERGSTGASNGWSSKGNPAPEATEWVEIALPAPRPTGRVTLYPRTDAPHAGMGFPVDFTVALWTGQDWETVVTRTGHPQPGAAPQSFTFPARPAERIRVTATKLRVDGPAQPTHHAQLAEIELAAS
ncbi:discoidin domain-containing protein [Crossiella sp. CA198]|uniref:discoidin domain-containing protein n=1 Tax=Crossiella sp. CA198 TaxID=3455607 RepID=UPI003F8D873D